MFPDPINFENKTLIRTQTPNSRNRKFNLHFSQHHDWLCLLQLKFQQFKLIKFREFDKNSIFVQPQIAL
jgi:hypothetical protein